jgi:hypothetical protein
MPNSFLAIGRFLGFSAHAFVNLGLVDWFYFKYFLQDYPPTPNPESGLSLIAVPAGNYYARIFSGRGGLNQVPVTSAGLEGIWRPKVSWESYQFITAKCSY